MDGGTVYPNFKPSFFHKNSSFSLQNYFSNLFSTYLAKFGDLVVLVKRDIGSFKATFVLLIRK